MEKSGDIDLLTETDQQVERKLVEGLLAKFPNHKYGDMSTFHVNVVIKDLFLQIHRRGSGW